jgi:outer membrane lipoprotein-sorting protein
VEKWRHALKSEGEAGGEACYVVDSLPARDSVRDESGYSKRHSCISKARFTLLRLETWDTEGQPQKVAEFSDSRVDASVPKETFSARAPEFGG